MLGTVTALVGAQFGSEGKGLVAAKLAHLYTTHVRTGAPNAGHTYYDKDGNKIVARMVPCGAINREALLVIGPGAFIDVDLLIEEAEALDAMGWAVTERLVVDYGAAVIDPVRHHRHEGGVHGEAHKLIGSTGEGVGPARMAKLARGTFPRDLAWTNIDQVGNSPAGDKLRRAGIPIQDTARMLNDGYDNGESILLEGTQGSGLSVVHGPWPYVTSTDTNAAQLAVDAGLAPQLVGQVILVARTFPIRVAGNSGPLPRETDWIPLAQEPEKTTVTRKERRVGWFHEPTVRRAIMLNRPERLALTFLDYLFPQAAGVGKWGELPEEARQFVTQAEIALGAAIRWVGTGPDSLVENTGADRDIAGRFLSSEVREELPPVGWPTFNEAYDVMPHGETA